MVLYGDRIVIPKLLRPRILEILHGAHQGCNSMLNRAKLNVWWPGMCKDIE